MLDPILIYSTSNPNKIAIRTKDVSISYEELNKQINNYFSYYKKNLSETKIAISIQDPLEFIKTFWALTRLGKEIFLLNYKTPTFNGTLLKAYRINILLSPKIKINTVKTVVKENEFKTNETKCFIFTSGSTNLPKCVIHSIKNFVISANHVSKECKFTSKSKWLLNLPLFHVSGLGIMFRSFLNNAELLIGNIQDFNLITHMSCVETQLKSLIHYNIKSLRCILVGGSKISETIISNALEKKLPIYKTYGLTETASAVTISKITKKTNPTSGKCLDHCKVKIKNNIIFIKSESLAQYYMTKTGLTKLAKNNWFQSNDLGYIENDHLIVTGRSDSIVIINGENISLETIETTINKHPAVINNKVISFKKNNTSIICTYINTKENLRKLIIEINKLIQSELSSLFIPNKYFLLNETNSLKHSKHELIVHAKKSYESEES